VVMVFSLLGNMLYWAFKVYGSDASFWQPACAKSRSSDRTGRFA
jgi:hypothetical protein